MGKYTEVPACGVVLAGDIPNDHPEDIKEIKKFLLEIDMSMADEQILDKLIYYLEHKEERERLIQNGLEYTSCYTQEEYAKRFLEAV